MDYADFVRGISFRSLQPHQPRPTGYRLLNGMLRRVGVQLETWNTQLPERDDELRQRLTPILRVPRMSTFAIAAIINRGVQQMSPEQAYVNVGVWHGFTFLAGMAGNADRPCIGVDNFCHKNFPVKEFLSRYEKFKGEQHDFRESDYRKYFAKRHEEPIGFYLFDGPHTYLDQYDGLKLAEPFFSEGCYVLVDDTNWDQVRQANLDFVAKSRYEYRTILDVRTPKSGHPTYWNGVTLMQRLGRKAAVARQSAAMRRAA